MRTILRLTLGLVLAGGATLLASCTSPPFRTGLEVLEGEGFASLRGRKVAVLTNPTGVSRRFESLIDLVGAADGVELVAILGPEHGARGDAQAGAAIADEVDARTGVPIFSLYGQARRPSRAMLRGADVVLFDIQDIGVRTYTYLSTLLETLRASAELGFEVWVLDRPNPIGADRFEGPVLEAGLESFVGAHTVPLRVGLTAGEFAGLANEELGLGARLRVVPMEGYRRSMAYEATRLPWVAPSPNIPTVETALVYAGTVLVEGFANLSEGRGTTRPFHLVGAPWVDARRLAERLRALALPGVAFREAAFTPVADKHAGERCHGIEIFVADRHTYRPVETAVAILRAIEALHPGRLQVREAALERLSGSRSLRGAIEGTRSLEETFASWKSPLDAYARRRAPHLLYR